MLAVGALVHKPLSQVPENALKFVVGVMLSAFGLFWVGEGLGVNWPGEDLSILAFVAAVPGSRRRADPRRPIQVAGAGMIGAIIKEILGLFVDDEILAIGILAIVGLAAAVALMSSRLDHP